MLSMAVGRFFFVRVSIARWGHFSLFIMLKVPSLVDTHWNNNFDEFIIFQATSTHKPFDQKKWGRKCKKKLKRSEIRDKKPYRSD